VFHKKIIARYDLRPKLNISVKRHFRNKTKQLIGIFVLPQTLVITGKIRCST